MGGVIGAVVGDQNASANRQAAANAQDNALHQWLSVNAPDIASQQVNFNQYQNAGNLALQNEQAMQMGPSAMSGIQTDPRLMQSQMAALQQLSQTGQMGMTPAEAAALNQAQQNAAAQAQAKNKQIQDQFARTGMGGSGAQLAAQLENSQGAAQMLANNSNQVAQNAQQNALQAIAQSGNLAGNISGQQFGQQADIARAKDYINQFNTQNAQNVSNQNTQAGNAAALRNLSNQQNVMNQNTQLQNQQQQYNKQLLQQQFNNQSALASGRAGQYQGIAQTQNQNAARTADMYAGIGQGVDTGVGALYNAYNRAPSNDGSNFEDYGQAGQTGQQTAQGGFGSGASYDATDAADAYTLG